MTKTESTSKWNLFRTKLLKALPFLVFFDALFFSEYALFGISDALLGIVFLFFARAIVEEPGLSFPNYLSRLVWFFIMSLTATLAGFHPVAMVIVSMVYLFAITLLHSDDYLPRNFFWLGMGYLLLLLYPVGPEAIGMRVVGTLLSMALTTVFVYLMRYINTRTGRIDVFKQDRDYVRRAFDEVGAELSSLAAIAGTDAGRLPGDSPNRAFDIAQEYAKSEYSTVFRQRGMLSGRQSYTFALLLCCEQISHLTHSTARNSENIKPKERLYFEHLSRVFLDYGRGKIVSVGQMTDRLAAFLEFHSLDIVCHEESWSGVLESMLRTLKDTRLSKQNSTPFLKSVRYRLFRLKEDVGKRNTQTRFAIRLSLVVGVGMVVDLAVTYATGTLFGIWIPMTAFAVMNTYNDETMKATRDNTIGTIIGVTIYSVLVLCVPNLFFMPIIVTLSYLVVLMDFNPITSVAAVTQMALTALSLYAESSTVALTRLILVVMAVICVLTVIFVLMNTNRSTTIHAKVVELERIDRRLARYVRLGVDRGKVDLWRTVQLLYYLHMNAELMARLAKSLTPKKEPTSPSARKRAEENSHLRKDVEHMLRTNYRFAMDAEHAVMLLDPRRDGASSSPGVDVRPDSTARMEHIDATAERLDDKMHELEDLRYLEKNDD